MIAFILPFLVVHQDIQPKTNKYEITFYIESSTLSELDVAKQLSRYIPFLNTQELAVYHNFLQVKTIEEIPGLEIENTPMTNH